jgi:flagellar hook-associated protein 2
VASAGVTFSGFNNVDFNAVVTALMAQASQPLLTLQSQQSDLQSQVTTYGTLSTRVNALQAAASGLGSLSDISAFSASSSNPAAVGVSSSNAVHPGSYDVVVQELARAQVTVSASSAPDATSTVVASGGTLTIGGVAVAVTSDMTLQDLADAINDTDGIGVQAAVVRTSATSYRLALTSATSGEANAFTVVNGLTGGAGVTFGDSDGNGVSGDTPDDNAVSASDASLLVNNIPVTSTSNTFEDVIPGVTFTAYTKDPSAVVRIDVVSDASAITSKLQNFVNAYNDIAKFVKDQRTSAISGNGASIGRDPLLRQLSSSLRSTLLGPHGSDVITRLSEIGVSFTQAGTLELDQSRLASALTDSPDNVRNVLAGADGAFPAISNLLTDYSQANGFIPTITSHLNDQIKAMGTQIDQMSQRLAQQRETLQQQFTEADLAMSQLKNQQSSLSSFGSSLGSL